jgi:hypothetical protein
VLQNTRKTKAITNRKKKEKKKMRQPVEMEPEPADPSDLNYVDLMHYLVTFFFSLRKKSIALVPRVNVRVIENFK